jgi:hypothetical protein
MGIAGVIARAKKTVQAGGLPGIVVELGDTLRSEAIPAPLRQAAARIANLLRVPESAERVVVPLVPERPPHAVDAKMNEEHSGVCPFTGQSAASLEAESAPGEAAEREQEVEARASELVADLVADASASAAEALEKETPNEPVASADTSKIREQRVEASAPAAKKVSESVAPAKPKSVAPAAKASSSSKSAPASRASVPPANKAKAKNEKTRGEVAAKQSPAKTSGRSSKGPAGKPSGTKKKK